MSGTAINNAMDAVKTFLSSDDDRLKYLNRQMAIMNCFTATRSGYRGALALENSPADRV